jgi:hypothetical protein
MAAVVLTELAVAVVLWLVFLALSRGMWTTPVGRQMVLSAAVALGEAGSLLALGLGLPVPLWVFACGFGAADVVVLRWVWLRVKARRVA